MNYQYDERLSLLFEETNQIFPEKKKQVENLF